MFTVTELATMSDDDLSSRLTELIGPPERPGWYKRRHGAKRGK